MTDYDDDLHHFDREGFVGKAVEHTDTERLDDETERRIADFRYCALSDTCMDDLSPYTEKARRALRTRIRELVEEAELSEHLREENERSRASVAGMITTLHETSSDFEREIDQLRKDTLTPEEAGEVATYLEAESYEGALIDKLRRLAQKGEQ